MSTDELVNSLTQSQQIDSEIELRAHEFLKRGPTLVKAKSRFSATETTATIKSEE